jgi:uncharacterized peroxidase-related enzyme
MSHLPSLADDASLPDFTAAFPEPFARLRDWGERLMYGASSFTLGERELIAGFVSGLNACGYCHGTHAAVAANHGIDPALLAALLDDPDKAAIDDRWRPLFAYLRKLTLHPSRVTRGDVATALDAGWSEQAVVDAALVCAYFNMLNRVVDGVGIERDSAYYRESGARLAAEARAGQARFANEEG